MRRAHLSGQLMVLLLWAFMGTGCEDEPAYSPPAPAEQAAAHAAPADPAPAAQLPQPEPPPAEPAYQPTRKEKEFIESSRTLLEAGLDVNSPQGGEKLTLLHVAAANNWAHAVETLVARGADVDARNVQDRTPLHLAAATDSVDAARALLQAGSATDLEDDDGKTPLALARDLEREKMVKLLTDAGAVQVAVRIDPEEVQAYTLTSRYLQEGGDPDASVAPGDVTRLHQAAANGHRRVAQLLLDNNAGIAVRDHMGRTPLHYAAEAGQAELVRLLLDSGASARVEDKRGRRPSALAEAGGHRQLAGSLRVKESGEMVDDIYRRGPALP